MTRPRYEPPLDQLREANAKRLLMEQGWPLILRKIEYDHGVIDWEVFWASWFKGYAEYKWRGTIAHDKYDTIILSKSKADRGMQYIADTPLALWFVAEFTDGIYSYRITGDEEVQQKGGRTLHTRDPHDIEPVIHCPSREFRLVVKK